MDILEIWVYKVDSKIYSSIEALHELWTEWCRIVNESMMSKIRVEDHCILLNQVAELYREVNINNTSNLHQYKNKLHKVNTETLWGIAYDLLSHLGIDSYHTLFHNNIYKTLASQRRDLTPSIILQRDQATARRYQ